ncbi:hypothetical protein [Leptospira kanakyensis]|uniref:hypothetical protein n=1 Tax=Leptospira kanakyensis TaxID=2484968 RepID=UPI00223D45D5|nr:hypothetical protein [Leptospira kanakyensis]MCW7470237.1 hypothetical protein [Leptospira kanakyensis]MCW7481329.1 hypothetical protein [Leptospira kanakyensis]
MKKLILFVLLITNIAIYAEVGKEKVIYLRGVDLTVDSATLKNGLTMQNSLIFNRLVGGTTSLSIPATNKFKGKGVEFGINARHSGLLGTDFGISFATLFSDSIFSADYSNSTARLGSGSSAMTIGSESFVASEFTSNRLQTANIKLAENIYIFHDSGNKFLEGLALRLGGEIYGNEVKSKSPYYFTNSVTTSTSSSGSSTVFSSGAGASSIEKLTYNEAYLNAILGLGYNLKIAEGHNISLGYEYLKSVANSGNYENKISSLLVLTPTIAFPFENKIKGKVDSELVGSRISIGYRFNISENVSFGLNYSHTEATHRVVDSKVKEAGNILTLFNGGTSNSINFLPFILGSQPGFGPFPENKDIRRQIGFEVSYRF